jgi:predicted enzyme related to lactoylglutathione lyase
MSEPSPTHGKICYLEMPSINPQQSADFFSRVFGWKIREDSDGTIAFDDPTGNVSGLWSTTLLAVDAPGLIVSIMVDDAVRTSGEIVAAGGTIEDPVDPDDDEIYGTFRDPSGNLLSIYQERRS